MAANFKVGYLMSKLHSNATTTIQPDQGLAIRDTDSDDSSDSGLEGLAF